MGPSRGTPEGDMDGWGQQPRWGSSVGPSRNQPCCPTPATQHSGCCSRFKLPHLVVAVPQMPAAQQMHSHSDAEDLLRRLVDDAFDPLGQALPLAVVMKHERGRRHLRSGRAGLTAGADVIERRARWLCYESTQCWGGGRGGGVLQPAKTFLADAGRGLL